MSDRVKLTLASFGAMMLPYEVGFTFSLLILTATLSTTVDRFKNVAAETSGIL